MRVERLSGPKTHIGWTPDATPKAERELVSLVREADLAKLERLATHYKVEWSRAVGRLDSAAGAAENAARVIRDKAARSKAEYEEVEA